MPIYEYRCDACQHELEALQKISDEPLVVCPKCNASALRKRVSAAGFRFTVLDVRDGRIRRLSAVPLPPEVPPEE